MRPWNPWGAGLAAAFLPLVVSATGANGGIVVWTGTGGNGHSYQRAPNGTASWVAAQAAAAAGGGYLASIDSAAEQALVERFLDVDGAAGGSYWFGLRESSAGGDYRLVDGAAPAYTHWNPGQPDDFAGREDSASILWSNPGDPIFDRRGFWNDLPPAGGYPDVGSAYPDLVSAGYLIEYDTRIAGATELQLPAAGSGDGGGPMTTVPLPAALGLFPLAAAVAAGAGRRLRRTP